jgi:hypothetical protein
VWARGVVDSVHWIFQVTDRRRIKFFFLCRILLTGFFAKRLPLCLFEWTISRMYNWDRCFVQCWRAGIPRYEDTLHQGDQIGRIFAHCANAFGGGGIYILENHKSSPNFWDTCFREKYMHLYWQKYVLAIFWVIFQNLFWSPCVCIKNMWAKVLVAALVWQ